MTQTPPELRTTVLRTPAPRYADLPSAPEAYHRSEAEGGRRKHRTPLAWLPWALIGAIALLLLLSLLFAKLAGGDGDGSARAGSPSSGNSSSRLTANGADLFSSGALRGHLGQAAVGSSVRVASVVADEAFWVGSGSSQVLVHLTPAARGTNGESPYKVKAGDLVDLSGTVQRTTSSTADDIGITASEGAQRLQSEGALIEARRVSLSS